MEPKVQQFVFVAAPKVLAGITAVAINLVLMRYFRPEDFGLYALCLAAINIADAVLGTAVDMSVMRLVSPLSQNDTAQRTAVQKAGLYAKIAAVGFLYLLLGVFPSTIEQGLFHLGGHRQLLYLTCLAILALLALRSAQAQMQIEGRFDLYSALEFLQMTIKFGGIGICLLMSRINPTILLICLVAGPGTAAVLWAVSRGKAIVSSSFPSPPQIFEFSRYLGWFLLTFSVAAFVARIDVFLVSTWSSVREAGIFSAGQTIASIPQLIGTYLSVILSPRIMPHLQQGVLLSFFRRFQTAMIACAVLLYLLAALTLPRLGPWFLPPKFMGACRVILLLLPGALAGLVTFPLTITVVMFLRPKFLVAMDCIVLPIALLAYHRFIALYGGAGAACVTSGICVIKAALAQFVAWSSVRTAARSGHTSAQALSQIYVEE